MSFIARSRANSEVSSSSNSLRLGAWVDDLFHRYQFPAGTFHDGTDMGGHRVEIHYLGLSYLQSGPHCVSSAAFYEITETADTVSSEELEHQPSLLLSSSSSPILSTPVTESGNMTNINTNSNNSNMLPPKKRRRHKVIRNDVIFCIDPPPASDLHTPSLHLDYYLFPHDAVAGPVNDVPPFEILFSFHVLDAHVEERRPTKLEEFAAVCSSANRMYPRRRSTDPGSIGNNNLSSAGGGILSSATSSGNYSLMATIPTMPVDDPRSKVVNMRISGVSSRLFVAIKQTVSEFETVCEKMVQLMTYHTQQMAGQKGSPTTTAPRPLLISPPSIPSAHSEWEELLNSRDHQRLRHPQHPQEQQQQQRNCYQKSNDACSSDDTNFDKDDMLVDPMPKSSYSNGSTNKRNNNSRRPTSPRSAPTSLNNNSNSSKNNNGNISSNNASTSKGRSNSNGGAVKKCLYCGSKSTPMWRRGPQGAGTLCNACGVKWKHGKILTGSSSTDMNVSSTPPTASKERRGSSNKNEKKRKKSSSGSGNGNSGRTTEHHHHRRTIARSTSTTPVMDSTPPFKSPSSTSSRAGHNYSDDDEMENNINAARNLSIRESEDEYHHHRLSSSVPSNNRMDTFAVPWLPRDNSNYTSYVVSEQQQRQQAIMMMTTEAQSLSSSSHSLAGSYSPIESSSPGSSPRLSSTASSVVSMQHHHHQHYQHQHTRRHTMDVTMADKMGYDNDSSFAMSVGGDAVEAAALLTLLKRS